MIRVDYDTLKTGFERVLLQNEFTPERAELCARIFADNTQDGVVTHGINRFPRFVDYIQQRWIDVRAEPVLKHQAGAIQQWDGRLGPGPLNAWACTDHAIELARKQGVGIVALANTNHWMRGGTYGWQAAQQGMAFIGWTNTVANMPAWGAKDCHLGNNPLVIAVPREEGAIVLDMAASQFSYGTIETAAMRAESLPQVGGFDPEGKLTCDPDAILSTQRILPAGYWKGAGLSLLLDLLATILSGGQSTCQISQQEAEYGVSQVFVALDVSQLGQPSVLSGVVQTVIDDYLRSIPADDTSEILYPGQRVLQRRRENLAKGIPVDKVVWDRIVDM